MQTKKYSGTTNKANANLIPNINLRGFIPIPPLSLLLPFIMSHAVRHFYP